MKSHRHVPAVAYHTARHSPSALGMAQHPNVKRIIRQPAPVTNLTVGSPNSHYERIADRAADNVIAMRANGHAQPHAESLHPHQSDTSSSAENTAPIGPTLATRIRAINGSGQPLPATERAFFEPRLRRDLSQVRIHTDTHAADLADNLRASAFTLGNNIVFSTNKYRPDTPSGRRLLAHELIHVMQQSQETGGVEIIQRQCADRLGSCDYYDCREEHHPCGSDGYYLGYGGKYCNRFNNETRPELSSDGQAWVDITTRCLQRYLENHIPYDADCDDVRRRAFDSHPDCYVAGGICNLSVSDWWKIFWTVDASDMEVRQALLTAAACPGEWWEDVERNVGYYLSPESLQDWMRAFGVPLVP